MDAGAALGSKRMRKQDKGDLAPDPDRIRESLERHLNEVAEDAPASGSAEDNP